MHPSVKTSFISISKKFEGYTTWMYLDVKGYVTTGIGNLIDSVGAAQALPWVHSDGSRASAEEVAEAWQTVKDRQDLALSGGGAFKGLTSIRLTDAGVATLVGNVADNFDRTLAKRWPGYDHWPADAQLALMLIAWAYGPNFKFSGFETAIGKLVPDFTQAKVIADAAFTREVQKGNTGIKPRQVATALAFDNAHAVMKGHGRISKLHYPSKTSVLKIAGAGIATAGVGIGGAVWLYNKYVKKG
jgi:hypothetical protein